MNKFTGYEYIMIDVATQYGLDKLTFEDRIQWTKDNMDKLESLIGTGDHKTMPLYVKAVMALRKAQNKIPTGHMVGVDASASGIQIMSVLTGCYKGAKATGLVDADRRADAYTDLTSTMNNLLGSTGFTVPRKDAKQAMMTMFYGSKKTPIEIFGEGTPAYNAFHQASKLIAPGAYELISILRESWNSYALSHDWKLPDGYDAHVKVMDKKTVRIEVQELGGSSFTYEYKENTGSKKGLSNIANVVHSEIYGMNIQ